jgi:ubiquinone/menaquinone biosynthesis C-methylase UbiE
VVMSDACADLVHALKAAWSHEESKAPLDFLAFDGNHMPFRDESLDGLTSTIGFQSVRQDRRPERRQEEGLPWDRAYREARRVLKAGGRLFEAACRFHVPGSKTAIHLEEMGRFSGLEARMEKLWQELEFDVVLSIRSEVRRGKADPGDGLPIDDNDEWFDVAYVLRKG